MRKLMFAAAAAGALFAAPSQAVTFLGSTPGPDSAVPAGVLTIDFNGPSVAGLSGNYHLVTGSVSGQYAQPFGGGTQYLSVPQTGSSGQATLDLSSYGLTAVDGFSFYWGSIDTYNRLNIQTSSGVTQFAFDGSNPPPPANGAQTDAANNRRVFFGLDGGETIQSIAFISTGIAFEVDDLVFTSSAVPEPATWAMMISGFGLVGGALRTRKRESAALAA